MAAMNDVQTGSPRAGVRVKAGAVATMKATDILKHWWAMPALFAVVMIFVYAPLLFNTFGYADDYLYLLTTKGIRAALFDQGRPISTLFNDIAYSLALTISDISTIRFVGVLGWSILAWQFYRLLINFRPLKLQAFWITLAMMCLPAFQALSALASTYSYSLSVMLGIAAAIWTETAFTKGRSQWARIGLAIIALIVSILIYQPSAMFYWVVVVILIFKNRQSVSGLFWHYVGHLAVIAVAMLLTYIFIKTGNGFTDSRAALVADVAGKAVWFVVDVLPGAFSLFVIPASPQMSILVGVFIAVGLWLYFYGDLKYRFAAFLICVSLLPVIYLPILAVAENWASHRSLVALSPLVLLYFFLAIRGYVRRLRPSNSRLAKSVLAFSPVVIAITVAILATYNATIFYANPLSSELGYMRIELAQLYKSELPVKITIITPRWQEADQPAPAWIYDEFGEPATAKAFGATSLARLLLEELGHNPNIEIEAYGDPGLPVRDNPVINMRLIRYLGLR